MARLTAIIKALNASEGDADRIGVMAVRCKGDAREAGFDAIDLARSPEQPVFSGGGQIRLLLG
jgi:hypothetical protein